MVRIPLRTTQLPATRAGLLVLGPVGPDGDGIAYRAWSPGEGVAVTLWIDARRVDEEPGRVERLARQALALERIRHPNLAEILRFDEIDGRFVIVERLSSAAAGRARPIGSEPPAGLAERPGPSEVRRAIGEALQAARGLETLHEHGLSHGNLCVGSLALLDDGRVILTGLGRVAPPAEQPTGAPASSEPASAAVRADLDALGRLLYERVTGTAAGPSPDPADTPHPDAINPRVPSAVSEVIRRLRLPADRGGHGTTAEAVADLERLAGAPASATFLPRASLVEAYRSYATAFVQAPSARLRHAVRAGFYGGVAALAGLSLLLGLTSLALGLIHLMAMTAVAGFLIGGARRGGALFDRTRRFVLGGRGRDLATVGVAAALAIAGLVAAGLLGVMISLSLVAIILAAATEVLIEDRLAQERREPIRWAAAVLRDLRLHGVAEPDVRSFAIDHGGEHWGPIFLALFGYDSYRAAAPRRAITWGERLLKIGALGRVIDFLDARLAARRDDRDLAVLTDLEERRLKAEGIFELTARRRAWRIAPALISRARQFERGEPLPGQNLASSLAEAVRDAEAVLEEEAPSQARRLRRRALAVFGGLIGPRARMLAGLALLAGSLAWAHQNRLIQRGAWEDVIDAARSASGEDLAELGESLDARRKALQRGVAQAAPLDAALVPRPLSLLFRHVGALVAAAILLLSTLDPRRGAALGAITGAFVALFGPDLGIPLGGSLALAVLLALAAPLGGRLLT